MGKYPSVERAVLFVSACLEKTVGTSGIDAVIYKTAGFTTRGGQARPGARKGKVSLSVLPAASVFLLLRIASGAGIDLSRDDLLEKVLGHPPVLAELDRREDPVAEHLADSRRRQLKLFGHLFHG